MAEMDLLDWARAHARRSDPETSHQAARQAQNLAGEHQRMILETLEYGPDHAEGIACGSDLTVPQVQRRLKELLTANLIELTGETRINSNGRRMRVFRRVGA